MNIISYIATQILGVPAILLGAIALVGLLVQKKDFSDIIGGTMKTIIGFMILGLGAGHIVGILSPIGGMLEASLGITGIVPNDEAIASVALLEYGTSGALIMVTGFFVNVIVARLTRFKYIYVTGHHLLYIALLVTVMLTLYTPLSGIALVLLGGLIVGIYCPLIIALVQPYMDKITNNAGIAYAHSTNIGCFIGAFLGKFVGDPEDSTEKIKLPKWAMFFRDTTLATGSTMVIVFIVVAFIAGGDVASNYTGTQDRIMWSIMQGLQFGAGITVLLAGVRMIIAEIVPAFKGISEKIVPDAKPGLDCPVVMPYAPNAWLLGFLISFPLGLIFTLLMAGPLAFKYVVIAGVVPHFFASGPAAVFGNVTGGKRGAILAAIISSVMISFTIALLIPLTGEVLISSGTTWGEMDYGILGSIIGYLSKAITGM
jgi:PTS system ascorbate-specific IIC component